jgi:hypothetical protein
LTLANVIPWPSLSEYLDEWKGKSGRALKGEAQLLDGDLEGVTPGTSFRVLSLARLNTTAKISIDDGGD